MRSATKSTPAATSATTMAIKAGTNACRCHATIHVAAAATSITNQVYMLPWVGPACWRDGMLGLGTTSHTAHKSTTTTQAIMVCPAGMIHA